MIKLLTIGDPHFSGTGPRAYKGNYKADILAILHECAELAYDHQCQAVLIPGDLTHSHIMSTAVLTEFVEVLKKFPCPVLTVAGNHDRESTNLEDLKAAPYGLLEVAGVIRDVSNYCNYYFADLIDGYKITGNPYDENTDRDVNQYTYNGEYDKYFRGTLNEPCVTIHLTHGMLLPDHPWWITDQANKADKDGNRHKYTTFAELAAVPASQRPHIIVNGHLHDGHPATFIDEKTLVVNYGAVCRLSRSLNEINRVLQVGLITIESPQKYWAEPIELKSQRPGNECLDRAELQREIERQKNKEKMSQYLELLGTKREIRTRNAREVIKQACQELKLPPTVEQRCLGRLDRVAKRLEGEGNG